MLPKQQKLAEIIWEADSREVLISFPSRVRAALGYQLYLIQAGNMPLDSKKMHGLGSGVYELREQDKRAWYRVIYLKKIGDRIHVLHCFEKRSAKTPPVDLKTAKTRLKTVLKRLRS